MVYNNNFCLLHSSSNTLGNNVSLTNQRGFKLLEVISKPICGIPLTNIYIFRICSTTESIAAIY